MNNSPCFRLCTGNLYTPTPELSISTISTTLSGPAPGHNVRPADGTSCNSGSGSGTGAWRWLPWSRKHSTTTPTPSSGIVHSQSDTLSAVGQLRQRAGQSHVQQNSARPPHWRYSHSDAIYGFRPPASMSSTMSNYNMTGLGQYSGRLDLTNIDSLSNLLWGPPPPYSQPSSTLGTSDTSPAHQVATVTELTSSQQESPVRSQSRLSRTTKSGILTDNVRDGNIAVVGSNTNDGSTSVTGPSPIHYDDTVDSAMHIYEKLRRSRSGSLPSRRVKKNRKIVSTSSSHNMITSPELTPLHLNQNLSALNLSRAEELRTAKDLEEIKRALIALQQNSLGILNNIQYDNSLYSTGNTKPSGDFQQNIEFSKQHRQENVIPTINQAKHNPAHKQKKSRGVYSVSNDHLVPSRMSTSSSSSASRFSLTPGGRKTTSTTNLISSGTDSDNSYSVSGSVSVGSRNSSNLSSPTPTNLQLSPYFTNQVSV